MSVSFCYEVKRPSSPQVFSAGTSSDIDAFQHTFGGEVSTRDLPVLRAMHRASGHDRSLWLAMIDVLEGFEGDTTLRVWTQF